jgi:acyl-coenzyme A thioesterase PaaI-like protein
MNIQKIVSRARDSGLYRSILNFGLNRMIPFNKPHGFSVVEIDNHSIRVLLPYKRRNFNHIRGLHACALATVSEFATGFLLTTRLDPSKYRLIMQRMEMDYHYQGKMDAFAEFVASDEWLENEIVKPLQSNDAIVTICEVKIHDAKGNHLTTGRIHWQIKEWQKVKTKMKA